MSLHLGENQVQLTKHPEPMVDRLSRRFDFGGELFLDWNVMGNDGPRATTSFTLAEAYRLRALLAKSHRMFIPTSGYVNVKHEDHGAYIYAGEQDPRYVASEHISVFVGYIEGHLKYYTERALKNGLPLLPDHTQMNHNGLRVEPASGDSVNYAADLERTHDTVTHTRDHSPNLVFMKNAQNESVALTEYEIYAFATLLTEVAGEDPHYRIPPKVEHAPEACSDVGISYDADARRVNVGNEFSLDLDEATIAAYCALCITEDLNQFEKRKQAAADMEGMQEIEKAIETISRVVKKHDATGSAECQIHRTVGLALGKRVQCGDEECFDWYCMVKTLRSILRNAISAGEDS